MDEIADDGTDNQGNFQGRRQIYAHADDQRGKSKGFRIARQQEIDDDGGDAGDNVCNCDRYGEYRGSKRTKRNKLAKITIKTRAMDFGVMSISV